jgi:adenosine deaminase
LINAANRDRGPDEARRLARLAASRAGCGIVGFGLDGNEAAHPGALFIDAFRIACNAGLPATPHAGELAGPDSVADAVDLLGAKRVLHGIRAIEDAELTRRLAAKGVCLDVCPTSNVLLSIVPRIETHPLPALLAAGVRCSINTDDPLLFDTDLVREYERCRTELGLTDHQLAAIARTSLEAATAPNESVKRASEGIQAWLRESP